jgi:hypothetical protein
MICLEDTLKNSQLIVWWSCDPERASLGISTEMMNWVFHRSALFVPIFWTRGGKNRGALRYALHRLSGLGKGENYLMS